MLLLDGGKWFSKKELKVKTKTDRTSIELFWIEVDFYDMTDCFTKVIRVITLLSDKAKGGKGKEMWVNLTGGSNVINLSLQLGVYLNR